MFAFAKALRVGQSGVQQHIIEHCLAQHTVQCRSGEMRGGRSVGHRQARERERCHIQKKKYFFPVVPSFFLL